MKQGLTVQQMVEKLDSEARRRMDVRTDSKNVSFFLEQPTEDVVIPQHQAHSPHAAMSKKPVGAPKLKAFVQVDEFTRLGLDITPNAHAQMANKLNMPKKYYDMLLAKHPELLRYDLSYLCANTGNRFLLRSMRHCAGSYPCEVAVPGNLRAVLSDKYRRLDNFELFKEAILPTFEINPNLRVDSCEITDDHFYVKATSAKREYDLRVNDPVNVGFIIKNSETGKSSLRVSMFINRLVCMNGMIAADTLRKYHVGRSEEDAFEVYKDETIKQDDKAFFMKVRDVINQVQDETRVQGVLNSFRQTMQVEIVKPKDTVEVVGKEFGLDEDEKLKVLEILLKNSHRDGMTMFGMVNAITQAAGEVDDYDRATELEQLGGVIINLPQQRQMALVAA